MSTRSLLAVVVLATASTIFTAPVALAQDATVHQVYQAAEAGNFTEAQAMMDKVLKDHPNSGKAHFVQAELFAKQGKTADATRELATAERLAPGLPFAKPEAVQHLRQRLDPAQPKTRMVTPNLNAPAVNYAAGAAVPAASSGMSMGTILLVVALVIFAIFMVRKLMAPKVPAGYPGGATGYGGGMQGNPAYPQYGQPGAGGTGGGIGSGIMGGLATGAALGAGMVAGEALMHRFTDGDRNRASDSGNQIAPTDNGLFSSDSLNTPDDMGGTDFGLNDSGSWDDGGGGGGGGDDWN